MDAFGLSLLIGVHQRNNLCVPFPFVQLMCKQLSIDVKDLSPGRLLHSRKRPVLAGNPDFNVKVPEPIVPGITVSVPDPAAEPAVAIDLNALPPVLIPKLASLSVVPPLPVFDRVPLLKVRGCSVSIIVCSVFVGHFILPLPLSLSLFSLLSSGFLTCAYPPC